MRLCLLTLLLVGCGTPDRDDKTADTDVDTTQGSDDTDGGGGGGGGADTDDGGGGGGDTDGLDAQDTDGAGGADTDTTDTDGDADTDLPTPAIGLYAADHAVSGTRLSRVAVEDELGNVALAWFHDTQLDVDCTVRTAADGLLRCLPDAVPFGGGVFTGAYYGDAGCSTTVAITPNTCGNSGYFTDAGNPETIYTFVGYYPTAYQSTGHGCGPVTLTSGTSAIGISAVSPTTFVAFTRSGEAVDADVGVEILTGADGSRVARGLWSVDAAQPATLDSGRAVPYQHDVAQDMLIRSTCASGTFDAYMARDPGFRPAWVVVTTYFHGLPVPPLRELREVVGESTTWCNNGSTVNADAGSKVYVIGAGTASWSSFPEVRGLTDVGSGPRFHHLVTASDAPITPWPASGGVQVYRNGVGSSIGRWEDRAALLPAAFTEPTYYGDSNCSQPVDSPLSGQSPGDLMLRRAGSGGTTCHHMPGAPDLFDGLWSVPASTSGSNRTIYVSSGSCFAAGQDVMYPLTESSASASTLLPEPSLATP